VIRRFVLLLVSGVALAATPEANKTAARRFYEDVWFGHKVDVVDELFAPEYLNHDPRDPDEKARSEGRKAPRATQKELARQQSGSTGRIDFQIAEGDRVMTRWVWTMPLAGGWERFVAGKDHIEISVVQIFRFDADGRIAEVWNHRDDRGIDDQMRISGLYYFEGIFFGIVIALVVSKVLRRRTLSPSSQSKTAS
jgi:predicted SnoaL-like aldol condensation-catalyzing enzyme